MTKLSKQLPVLRQLLLIISFFHVRKEFDEARLLAMNAVQNIADEMMNSPTVKR
jgi:hypothetical protein